MCEGGKLFLALGGVDGCRDAEMATEHPIDIAVNHCYGQVEGDRANGGSGVVANALERAKSLCRGGKATQCHDLFGGGVKVASTTIIA